jgi:hypothetical protein
VNGLAAFVSEIEADDSGFVFSTYLGGAGSTYGYGIATGAGGIAYVAGATGDLDFPTQNGLQPAFASSTAGSQAFLSEVGPGDGALLAVTPSPASVLPLESTTFRVSGGSGGGYAFSLVVNASGGSIDPTTGAYEAGPHGGTLDVVEVRDSAGTRAAAAVLVGTSKLSDGGIEAGGDGAPTDARVSDARPDATREGGSETSFGDAGKPPVFTAGGSDCSHAGPRRHAEPVVGTALSAAALLLAARRRRRRHDEIATGALRTHRSGATPLSQ